MIISIKKNILIISEENVFSVYEYVFDRKELNIKSHLKQMVKNYGTFYNKVNIKNINVDDINTNLTVVGDIFESFSLISYDSNFNQVIVKGADTSKYPISSLTNFSLPDENKFSYILLGDNDENLHVFKISPSFYIKANLYDSKEILNVYLGRKIVNIINSTNFSICFCDDGSIIKMKFISELLFQKVSNVNEFVDNSFPSKAGIPFSNQLNGYSISNFGSQNIVKSEILKEYFQMGFYFQNYISEHFLNENFSITTKNLQSIINEISS